MGDVSTKKKIILSKNFIHEDVGMLKDGLYELLVNQSLSEELSQLDVSRYHSDIPPLGKAEASEVLTQYIAQIVKKHLEKTKDLSKAELALECQVNEANKILSVMGVDCGQILPQGVKQLLSFYEKQNNELALNDNAEIIRPATSLAHSSLFTGADMEPQMLDELKKEIVSSDRIDLLVSFIKWSGLRRLLPELNRFTMRGGVLRIISTTYTGATDVKCLDELLLLPNTEIKISYDGSHTRLHAKAYMFHRITGFDTAYVGSSNVSNSALHSGLEWNLKVTKQDMPKTMAKIDGTFDSYWNSPEFETYKKSDRERFIKAIGLEKRKENSQTPYATFDLNPFHFQQQVLDSLKTDRELRNHNRNLVVAATGTGKTLISAFDYRRFRKENPQSPARLLFIAHREEILAQSLAAFRAVLKDQNFGELLVGSHAASSPDYLFVSIQSLNSKELWKKTGEDFYDFIIVDEFHHSSAPSYQKLLNYYKPKILLGLTATPERMDGQNVLDYFDGRITAEIRLPEAIDRKLLCPFQYFGITDPVDLSKLRWSRGGYDKSELSNIYTVQEVTAKQRAGLIIGSIDRYLADKESMKALAFCVSKEHARFMAKYFNENGIASISLDDGSNRDERGDAKRKLVSGEIKIICTVNLYNEGVDIPEVNTVLFLRPTESLTVFLQQLGRGLRMFEGKDCLTVLDFVGQANKKYNFEQKFAALLSRTRKSVLHEIQNGFISVPKGCYIQLEKVAQDYILKNIKSSYGTRRALVERISSFEEDSGKKLSLKNFLEFYNMEPAILYRHDSFSRLCVEAGVKEKFKNPDEEWFSKSFLRWVSVDSRNFIHFVKTLLRKGICEKQLYNAKEIRMLQMIHFTMWDMPMEKCGYTSFLDCVMQMLNNKELCEELIGLLEYKYEKIDFVDKPLELSFDCPLDLHCSYSKGQILAACDVEDPSSVREGVRYVKDKNVDLFFVTLNKSEKDYSDSTLYDDYSINESMFHWQSQSTTTEVSDTAARYITGMSKNNEKTDAILFVREEKKDSLTKIASPYTCLGKVKYVNHKGSAPMSIVWGMKNPIPAKYLKKTNKLLVG